MSIGIERIKEEFADLTENPIGNCGITVGLMDESDYTRWRVSLIGPRDSSYVNGLFKLSVTFPDDYPQKQPEVCFLTPIYHVNVNPRAPKDSSSPESLGHVCISTLNWWKPEYRMREFLTNIFALFYMHNPESPYGLDRAKEYNEDRALYEEKIKHFTKKYALPEKFNIEYSRTEDWDFSI